MVAKLDERPKPLHNAVPTLNIYIPTLNVSLIIVDRSNRISLT